MANRWGHQPILLIGKEVAYGTAQTTPTEKVFDSITFTDNIEELTFPQKTQSKEYKKNETHSGYKTPGAVMTGIVTDSHEWLLKAWCGKAGTPYTMEDDVYSYTIYRAFPAATADAGDGEKLTGAVLSDLEFTVQGGFIGFTATFRGKELDREADLNALTLTTVTNTSYTELTPFSWVDVTCSLSNSATAMDTFTLTLTKEFPDNATLLQNSETRSADYFCKAGGTLAATTTYDDTNDAAVFDYLYSQDDIYDDTISFVNDNATWAFTLKGQFTAFDLPDIEKCKYKSSFTKKLVGDTDEVHLSVVIT